MKRYYVGCGPSRASAGPWFGFNARVARRQWPATWANHVICKTLQHALAQYRRLPIARRQIDVHGDGKARALIWGRSTSLRQGDGQ